MGKITLVRGATEYLTEVIQDMDGQPLDLTGSTVYFTVKTDEWDEDSPDAGALIKKNISDFNNPKSGEVEIKLLPTDTYVTPGEYYYDVRVKDTAGDVALADDGQCTISGTPTNRSKNG
jgi:hypothetical protein